MTTIPGTLTPDQQLDHAIMVYQRHRAALEALPGVRWTAVGKSDSGAWIIRAFIVTSGTILPADVEGVSIERVICPDPPRDGTCIAPMSLHALRPRA